MFVMHPFAKASSHNSKLIPKGEINFLVGAFPPNLMIRCASWSRSTPLKPRSLKTDLFTIKQAVVHSHIMPFTYAQGMAEPQVFASDTYGKHDLNFSVEVGTDEPIFLSGNTLIYFDNRMQSIRQIADRYNGTELHVPCVDTIPTSDSRVTMTKKIARIKRRQRPYTEDAFTVGLWDQPQRVAHTNGKLITASGLILG